VKIISLDHQLVVITSSNCDPGLKPDCARKDKPVVVVSVFSDKIDPPRSMEKAGLRFEEAEEFRR
jgi:hypothetical protein